MNKMMPFAMLAFICLMVLPAGAQQKEAPPSGAHGDPGIEGYWFGPGPIHKVIVYGDEQDVLEALRATGAVVDVLTYESFAVVFVDETSFPDRAALESSGLRFRDELDVMVLGDYRLHGKQPEGTLQRLLPEERVGLPNAPALDLAAGLYLVQFKGPIQDSWRAGLERAGVRVIQYVPNCAYLVQAEPQAVSRLLDLSREMSAIQYVGEYQPAFKMSPGIRSQAAASGADDVRLTVQLVDGQGSAQALDGIVALMSSLEDIRVFGPYINVRGWAAPGVLRSIAHNPFVTVVEERGVITRSDERQGQIIAGNVTATGPSAPGYLAWLAAMGFDSSQFSSFSVNVVDDATSLLGHPDLPSGRVAFQQNPTSQGGNQSGHGFLNAHIVGGFNDGTGAAVEDSGGYNYGLGVAPWARVGATAIFGSSSASATSWEDAAHAQGARISTNSWNYLSGIFGSPIPTYTVESQEYDFIVRDARSSVAGNQEHMVIFTAANQGPGSNSVSTPGTAKNVLTVGASENDRQTGTDGCGIGNSGANDIDDIISFSSRGPTNDGRWKPEIVAPGTHIQAGVPQSNFDGTGVCDAFWPSGQTLYGWSSGTSHAAPAIAGGAALVRQWFLNQAMSAPSPAMTKAVLINSSEYLTGVGANDTLPSNSQGMGRMNLGRGFDAASRVIVDQSVILGGTGQSHVVSGQIDNTGKPFRVTLVWTDAPGTSSSAPWVNDLDLTVSVGGGTYNGNVFAGAHSTTGGNADFRNNVESVFLPAGSSGAYTVTVTASNIAGDGVPGNGDATDQDFALIIWNGTDTVTPPAAPSGLAAAASAPFQIDLTWNDNSNNESDFEIQRSPDGVAWAFLDTAPANATSYSDTGLTGGSTHHYRVRARNTAGDSAWSNAASDTTPTSVTIDYRATSDIAVEGSVSGTYQDTTADDGTAQSLSEILSSKGRPANRHSVLTHTWTFSLGAASSFTFHVQAWRTGGGPDDFRFRYSSDNDSWTDMLVVSLGSEPSAGTTQSFPLPSNLSGTFYVQVVDTDSSPGEQVNDTVHVDDMFIRAVSGGGGQPPAAPSNLSAAAASSSAINLSWQDNSGDETGFEIERSPDGATFAPIATTGPDATSFQDAGLPASTTFHYRVRAVNGNGSSGWSNTANATTQSGGGGTVDDLATGETLVLGELRAGSYLSTQADDGVAENLREERSGGQPQQRVSRLENRWSFQVTGGSQVELIMEAWTSSGSNDGFAISYSTDGGQSWSAPVATVSSATPTVISATLPASLSGAVLIRAVDTLTTAPDNSRDDLFIDYMIIRSTP